MQHRWLRWIVLPRIPRVVHSKVGFWIAVLTASSWMLDVYLRYMGMQPKILDLSFEVLLILFCCWLLSYSLVEKVRIKWLWFVYFVCLFALVYLAASFAVLKFGFRDSITRNLLLSLIPSELFKLHNEGPTLFRLVIPFIGGFIGIALTLAVQSFKLHSGGRNSLRLAQLVLPAYFGLLLLPLGLASGVIDGGQRIFYRVVTLLRGETKERTEGVVCINADLSEGQIKSLVNILDRQGALLVVNLKNPSGRVFGSIHIGSGGITDIDVPEAYSARRTNDTRVFPLDADIESGKPMCFTPSRGGISDISVRTASMALALTRKTTSKNSAGLPLGDIEIPVSSTGSALISYQIADGFPSLPVYYCRLTTDGMEMVQVISMWGRHGREWLGGGGISGVDFQLDLAGGQTLGATWAPTPSKSVSKTITHLVEEDTLYRHYEQTDLPLIRNRVVVIGPFHQTAKPLVLAPWNTLANVYGCIIQSILARDLIREPFASTYPLVHIIVVALVFLLTLRLKGSEIILLVTGALPAFLMLVAVLFVYTNTFVNPYPFALGVVAAIGFFVPARVSYERRLLTYEKIALQSELRAAHDMQMGLMPKEDPTVPGFEISGICLPANEVGGDFFDYVWLDVEKTKLGIAVADVSGKAMKAAITAVMTSGMIYREIGQNESPKSIMQKINKPMYAKLDSRTFTALSFARIDTQTKELKFSNAGQAYPVLKRGKEVTPLEVEGARLPLGVKEDVPYGEMTVKLQEGDTVVFYTDGIPEAKNQKDEFYGFDRFKMLVSGLEGLAAKESRDRILEDVKQFTGTSLQYDDMTVVVLKVV